MVVICSVTVAPFADWAYNKIDNSSSVSFQRPIYDDDDSQFAGFETVYQRTGPFYVHPEYKEGYFEGHKPFEGGNMESTPRGKALDYILSCSTALMYMPVASTKTLTANLDLTRAFAVFYLIALPVTVILLIITSIKQHGNEEALERAYSRALACSIAAFVYWNIALVCHSGTGSLGRLGSRLLPDLPIASRRLTCPCLVVYQSRRQAAPMWTLGPAFYVTIVAWFLHGGTISAQLVWLPRASGMQLGKALANE